MTGFRPIPDYRPSDDRRRNTIATLARIAAIRMTAMGIRLMARR
jgi:hypothetical protein